MQVLLLSVNFPKYRLYFKRLTRSLDKTFLTRSLQDWNDCITLLFSCLYHIDFYPFNFSMQYYPETLSPCKNSFIRNHKILNSLNVVILEIFLYLLQYSFHIMFSVYIKLILTQWYEIYRRIFISDI